MCLTPLYFLLFILMFQYSCYCATVGIENIFIHIMFPAWRRTYQLELFYFISNSPVSFKRLKKLAYRQKSPKTSSPLEYSMI